MSRFLCVIVFLLVGLSLSAQHHTLSNKLRGENKVAALESILSDPKFIEKDSITTWKEINSLYERAKEEKVPEVEVVSDLLAAEFYANRNDQLNPKTDFYFARALSSAKRIGSKELQLIAFIREGYHYFGHRELEMAIPYFLQAGQLVSQVDRESVPQFGKHINQMSSFYGYIGNYPGAIELLQEALPYAKDGSGLHINMVNSMGVFSEKQQLFEQAVVHFQRALGIAQRSQDSLWMGIIFGNLAKIEEHKGNAYKAIRLLEENVRLSVKYNETTDAMRAMLNIADVLIDVGKWTEAEAYLIESEKYLQHKPSFLQTKTQLAKLRFEIAHFKGDQSAELSYLTNYVRLDDSLRTRERYDELQRAYWQWQSDEFQRSIEAAKEERESALLLELTFGLFLTAVLVIIILLLNRSKNKLKIKSAILEKEKFASALKQKVLAEELETVTISWKEAEEKSHENTTLIADLQSNLKKLGRENDSIKVRSVEALDEMLKEPIMTDDRWAKFKLTFDQVFPDYLSKKRKRYPRLTEGDQRLLALMKLKYSNMGMASLLGISLDGVKKAKQRLKKKMEEPTDTQ